jgi:hypothetical protein
MNMLRAKHFWSLDVSQNMNVLRTNQSWSFGMLPKAYG